MKDSITIQQAGFYTTIQDKGRLGVAHIGVPESGVMDTKALQIANALINNPENTAVLEYTLIGPIIRFDCERHFIITGAITEATLDGQPIKNHKVYLASKGQILKLSKITKGCRGYLSIAGGILSTQVLNSRSMYVPITRNATITKGTQLSIGKSNYGTTKGARLGSHNTTTYLTETVLKVYKGPEYDLLPVSESVNSNEETYTISKLWNRMAVQLEETLTHTIPSIQTGPVLPGTVQITPAGRIIILMKDCQTTGGYPRIFQLSEDAINILAQKKQGDIISFLLID